VFVDCGAYDGYTTLDFIRRTGEYKHIYVFEPDQLQYEIVQLILLKYGQINNCDIYNLGCYNHDGVLTFETSDYGSSKISDKGISMVSVTSLDSLLYEKPSRPTFIKMDIEGAELNALEGARRIIERDKPTLAISAYHGCPNMHIWQIPYWIKSNFSDYTIYFRQHASFNETVCYAIQNKQF